MGGVDPGGGESNLVGAALAYAERGWRVFPLHSVRASGQCTCSKAGCDKQGKHPRTANGLDDGTVDQAQIREYWRRWPEANVGIVTGHVSGLVVLDVDPRHGGEESFEDLKRMCGGALPETVEALTGGGGRHLLFQHPGREIRCAVAVGGLAGIDVRADRGYIVAPPSRHVSGHRYEWEVSSHPDEVPLAVLPPELLALVAGDSPGGNGNGHPRPSLKAPVPEGERNRTLASVAGSLRLRGADEKVISAALRAVNEECCPVPLPETEVGEIAASIAGYPAGTASAGNGMPAEAGQSQPAGGPPTSADAIHLTDLGNADRLARDHGHHLRYCQPWQAWVSWDGCRWVRDRSGEAVRRAEATVRAMYAEAQGVEDSEARRTLAKHALRCEAQKAIAAMLELAKADLRIAVLPEDFDRDDTRYLLNVLNGTVDLRTGQLRPHRAEDHITKLAPIVYDPTATCPEWDKFLVRVLPDDEVRGYVQRFAGYALTGDTSEQVLGLLYGTGANGKSTFLETLKALLGDYAHKTDFETFLEG